MPEDEFYTVLFCVFLLCNKSIKKSPDKRGISFIYVGLALLVSAALAEVCAGIVGSTALCANPALSLGNGLRYGCGSRLSDGSRSRLLELNRLLILRLNGLLIRSSGNRRSRSERQICVSVLRELRQIVLLAVGLVSTHFHIVCVLKISHQNNKIERSRNKQLAEYSKAF